MDEWRRTLAAYRHFWLIWFVIFIKAWQKGWKLGRWKKLWRGRNFSKWQDITETACIEWADDSNSGILGIKTRYLIGWKRIFKFSILLIDGLKNLRTVAMDHARRVQRESGTQYYCIALDMYIRPFFKLYTGWANFHGFGVSREYWLLSKLIFTQQRRKRTIFLWVTNRGISTRYWNWI